MNNTGINSVFHILSAVSLLVPHPVCAAHRDSTALIPVSGPCCVWSTSHAPTSLGEWVRVVCIVDSCGNMT